MSTVKCFLYYTTKRDFMPKVIHIKTAQIALRCQDNNIRVIRVSFPQFRCARSQQRYSDIALPIIFSCFF